MYPINAICSNRTYAGYIKMKLLLYAGSDYDPLAHGPRLMKLWGPLQTEPPSNSLAPVLNIFYS